MIATDFRIITEEKEVLKVSLGDECVWLEDIDQMSIKLTFEEARELIECLQKVME